MAFGYVLSLLLVVGLQQVNSYRWAGVTVDNNSWYELLRIDYSIIGRNEMVFAILGCKGADIILYEKVDDGGYVYLRFGDADNQYSLMFASTHCDDNGCSPGHYHIASHLDCNAYKLFWARWDNIGGIEVGFNNIVGQDVFMYMNYDINGGGRFTLRYAKVTANVAGLFVTFQFFIDTPPEITDPDPNGLDVISISEDSPVGTVVTKFAADDAENDTLLWGVVDEYTARYAVNYTTDTIETNGTYDYEVENYFYITIGAYDGFTLVNTTLNIDITDVDDNAPVLTVKTGLTMYEELLVDTILGGYYTLTDADTFQTFTYTLSGTDVAYFKIDNNGKIQLASRVDRESLGGSTLTFTLTVEDTGGNKATDHFTITVIDTNDNMPTCTEGIHFVTVTEAGTSKNKIADMNCSDTDDGVNAQLSAAVSSGDTHSAFSTTNLEVYVDTSLVDYETLGSTNYYYFVTVAVTDTPAEGPVNTAHTAIVAEVLPTNEQAPQWNSPTPTGGAFPDVSVDENIVSGTPILTYTAKDTDHGTDGVIKYEIVSITADTSASAPKKFRIDPENGELRLAETLDAEAGVKYYDVVIKASDKGATPKSIQATQKISINNVNDNPPVFNSPVYEVALDESVGVGDKVLDVDVTDVDGDTVTLTLSGSWLAYFEVSGKSINVKKAFDFETGSCYSVGITASDGVHTTFHELTVTINNVNDESPVITISSYKTVLEETPTGTTIFGYYTVIDPDGSDTFTFTLSGTGQSYFTLDANGNLVIASRIDREALVSTSTTLQLTLKVDDSVGNTATESFAITVLDINDNTPTCSQTLFTFSIEEAGTSSDQKLMDAVTCTDTDEGNNAVVTLNITSGNSAGIFRYNGFELWGNTTKIDYESLASTDYKIRLVVEAKDTPDEGNPSAGVFIVIIDVTGKNEAGPTFTNPVLNASTGMFPDEVISEDKLPGFTLLTFAASDADHGVDGEVHFEIVSITSDAGTSVPDMFKVGYRSGKLVLSGSLDADTSTGGVAYYDIVVSVGDGGPTPLVEDKKIRVTVTGVNDNAPEFKNVSYEVSVNENAAVNDVVATLTTSDADGDTLTLSAFAGDNSVFGVSGQNLVVLAALDFESQNCYYLDIRAKDADFNTTVSVTIKVNNVNDEAPVITPSATLEIFEETPVDTILYGLYTVTDSDVEDSLTFTVTGTDAPYFTVHSSGDLKLAKRLDRESGATSLTVDVTVTDAAGTSTTQTLALTVNDVNDNAPSCDKNVYFHSVVEMSGADAKLMDAINCNDADAGDNANFVLAITDGDTAGVFRYEGTELWGAGDSIDMEVLASKGFKYHLTVSLTDQPSAGPQNTGYILVVITVNGSNEFTPKWNITQDGSGYFTGISKSEDSAVGTSLTTFTATDDDGGLDGELTYQLVSVKDDGGTVVNDQLWISPETGVLYLANLMDADGSVNYYDIEVKAVDSGAKEVTGKLKLTPTTANDNPPVFTDTAFVATVAENVNIGHTVTTLGINDPDGDTVTLSVEGTWTETFRGDGLSILTKATLDYETERCYSLLVRASDGVHTTDRLITVEVTDVDDVAPVLTIYTGVTVPEEMPYGVIVGDVFSVKDPDSTSFTYTLSGSQSSYFEINSTTGHLYIVKILDRDGSGSLAYLDGLSVTVTDPSGLSDTESFRIDVDDINDMTPVFSKAVYSATVKENSANAKLFTLACTDDDTGVNGDVTMSIPAAGNMDSVFSLTGNDLFANGSLIDYETKTSYDLPVICVDTPATGPAKTGATVVQIQITGDNEHDPVWDTFVPDGNGNFPGVSVSETDAPGKLLQTFTATDADAGADGDISFEIKSIKTAQGTSVSNIFFMDPDAGKLQTAVELDADVDTGGSGHYDVVVLARDGGATVRSVMGTIRVNVTDADDNGPKFTKQLYEAIVPCNNVINDVITTVAVTDADSTAGTFNFSLPTASTKFSIDGTSGAVSLLVEPDTIPDEERRQFIVVKATDASDSNRTDTATVYALFDDCGETTTEATATTTSTAVGTTSTSTTEAPSACPPSVNPEVIILAVLCGIMGIAFLSLIVINARHLMRAPPNRPPPELHGKRKMEAFERPLEHPSPREKDDLTLEDPSNQFVFDSLPPHSTIGGRFEQIP